MLFIVRNEIDAVSYWTQGKQAITWSAFEQRLLRLDESVQVASRSLEHMVLEPLLTRALPDKLATLAPMDAARRKWIDAAGENVRLSLTSQAAGSWIPDVAAAFCARLRELGFVPAAGVAAHLVDQVQQVDISTITSTIGAPDLCAAANLTWTVAELNLWLALRERLMEIGGSATAFTYALDLALDAESNKSPFDRFADLYNDLIGEPPQPALVAAPLGDLSFADARQPSSHVEVVRATTKQAWRESIVNFVNASRSLEIPSNEIALVYATPDSGRQALQLLESIGIAASMSGGREPSVVLEKVHLILDLAVRPPIDPQGLALLLSLTTKGRGAGRLLERRRFLTSDPTEFTDALKTAGIEAAGEVEALVGKIAALRGTRPAEQHALLLREALELLHQDISLPSAEARTWAATAEHAQLRALSREQGALREVDDLITEIVAAYATIGSESLPFDTFASCMRARLSRAARSVSGSRIAAVQIASFESVSAARAVAFLDVQRDQFPPAPKSSQSFAPSSRANIVEHATRWASVMYATSRAEKLALLFSSQGEDGSAVEPSRAVTWLERNSGRSKLTFASPPRGLPANERRVCTEERRARSFFFEPVLESPQEPARYEKRIARATGASTQAPMRATFLEPFEGCSFAGFASAVLRARRDDDTKADPDPRELGRLQHGALEAAFLATREEWKLRPRDEHAILERGRAAAIAFLSTELGNGGALMIDRISDDCTNLMRQSLADLQWNFALAEQAFDGRQWASYVLSSGHDTVYVSGRIDRVDVSHDGTRVRVVDYKSSTSTADDARRKPLQLLIYANVAKRELGIEHAEGLYWPVRPRSALDKKGVNLDDQALLAKACEATLIVRKHLPVANGLPAICDKCRYDLACRKPRYVVSGLVDDKVES